MTKAELIDAVAQETGHTKKAVGEVLESVLTTVKGADKVTLVGFGTFQKKTRAARSGRNPQTGEALQIAAKEVFTFKASKK